MHHDVARCGGVLILIEEQRDHKDLEKETDSQITTRTSAAFRLREMKTTRSLCNAFLLDCWSGRLLSVTVTDVADTAGERDRLPKKLYEETHKEAN